MEFKELLLPCLRGAIGNWVFYSTIIPFSELQRIDTNHKIKEDRSLDRWLQREIDGRVESIKDYLLNEKERFFNSIIVGLYGESPDWYSLDLSILSEKFNLAIKKEVQESLGVLNLSGKEILFTVDGQHRIEAIKLALAENKGEFQNDELSVIFVGHLETEKGYVRTRKLFATINREAKKPSKNDLAIIDESFAHNIVARMIYANYPKLNEKIALTENYDLDRNDRKHFTNLLNIVEINKKLFKSIGYRDKKFTSPTFEERNRLYDISVEFFEFVFSCITEYKEYFSGKKMISDFRNKESGKPLNLLFLPIGLLFLADIYSIFKTNGKLDSLKKKVNSINFDLYQGDFKYIFFHPVQNRVITSNKVLARKLVLYRLNEDFGDTESQLKSDLAKAYNINILSPEFISFELPKKN